MKDSKNLSKYQERKSDVLSTFGVLVKALSFIEENKQPIFTTLCGKNNPSTVYATYVTYSEYLDFFLTSDATDDVLAYSQLVVKLRIFVESCLVLTDHQLSMSIASDKYILNSDKTKYMLTSDWNELDTLNKKYQQFDSEIKLIGSRLSIARNYNMSNSFLAIVDGVLEFANESIFTVIKDYFETSNPEVLYSRNELFHGCIAKVNMAEAYNYIQTRIKQHGISKIRLQLFPYFTCYEYYNKIMSAYDNNSILVFAINTDAFDKSDSKKNIPVNIRGKEVELMPTRYKGVYKGIYKELQIETQYIVDFNWKTRSN